MSDKWCIHRAEGWWYVTPPSKWGRSSKHYRYRFGSGRRAIEFFDESARRWGL